MAAASRSLLFGPVPDHLKQFYAMPYRVSSEQILSYEKDGFVYLPGVVSDETLPYIRDLIDAAVADRTKTDQRTLAEKSQYEQSFLQCGYLCWDYPAVQALVFARRFAGIARELLQVEHVRLWHDQALYKEPGGRRTDCHQDISYWPVNSERTLTLWLALCDIPREKGCLRFLPETHRSGLREYVDIFNAPHMPADLESVPRVDVPLKAGEATCHSGLLFHEAYPNQTGEMRAVMTIIYIDAAATYDASDPRNRYHKSCLGLEPGAVIDTQYTPVLI
jgi:ectoine hydroxylase-related dioxygenase (phytanoyl-CoA dioxygenase family)